MNLLDRVLVDEHGCWLWQGYVSVNGYGIVGMKKQYVHRLAYETLVGPIPPELQIDHLCLVKRCCNPVHLELVTPAENTRRAHKLGKNASKTHCPRGHAYDATNTAFWRRKNGVARVCKTCRREQYHERKAASERADAR